MSHEDMVLIIGGAGYIGSHTTLALKDSGYRTVVYDNFSTGHSDSVFSDHLAVGDIQDTKKLRDTLRKFKISCVVHFAALIEADQSLMTPLPFFATNVGGTISLLQAMDAEGVTRLVFSSTAAVYGDNADVPFIAETAPKAPINPYGSSKAMVEMILEACVKPQKLQSIALRYFNASAADAKGRTGERHDPETHLIPLVMEAALGKRPQINIYGTDYDTPDGTCIRDYIHVTDLANGHVAAVTHLLKSNTPSFEAINLGTGSGLSVKEVITAVKNISGIDFPVVETERRRGDPPRLIADVTLARSILGWEATHSNIEKIVKDGWAYAKSKSDEFT